LRSRHEVICELFFQYGSGSDVDKDDLIKEVIKACNPNEPSHVVMLFELFGKKNNVTSKFINFEKLVDYALKDCIAVIKTNKTLHSVLCLAKHWVYLSKGKRNEAEDVLREALKIDGNNLYVLTELSRLLQAQENYHEAAELLERAIEIDWTDLPTRTELSKVHQALKDYPKAATVLEWAIEIDKNDVHSYVELGRVYQKQENNAKAAEVLERAIKIDEKNLPARTELLRQYSVHCRILGMPLIQKMIERDRF
jgi:tetratricopeptide (TPR) repeat protein